MCVAGWSDVAAHVYTPVYEVCYSSSDSANESHSLGASPVLEFCVIGA